MYNVEATFNLEDNVSPKLKKLVEALEKADAVMKTVQDRIEALNPLFKDLAEGSALAAKSFNSMIRAFDKANQADLQLEKLEKRLGILNATLMTNAERAVQSGEGLSLMGRASAVTGQKINLFDKQLNITNAELQTMGARTVIAGQGFMFMGRNASTASGKLAGANNQFAKTGQQAMRATQHISNFAKAMHHAGGGFVRGIGMGVGLPIGMGVAETAGMGAEALAAESIKGGMRYQQALSQLQMSGLFTPKEQVEAEQHARSLTRQVPVVSLHEALDMIKNSAALMPDVKTAFKVTPMFAQAGMVMKAQGGAGQEGETIDTNVQTLEKAMTKMGVLYDQKTKTVNLESTKAVLETLLQARSVDPLLSSGALLQTLNTMAGGRYGLVGSGDKDRDRQNLGTLSLIIAEMSSKTGAQRGSVGQAYADIFSRTFGAGRTSSQFVHNLQKIGALPTKTDQGQILKDKDIDGHLLEMLKGPVGKALASAVQTKDVRGIANAMMEGAAKFTGQDVTKQSVEDRATAFQKFTGPFGSKGMTKAMFTMLQMLGAEQAEWDKKLANMGKVKDKTLDMMSGEAKGQTAIKMESAQKSWESFTETLGKTPIVLKTLNAGFDMTIKLLNKMSDFVDQFTKKYPELAKGLGSVSSGIAYFGDKLAAFTDGLLARAEQIAKFLDDHPIIKGVIKDVAQAATDTLLRPPAKPQDDYGFDPLDRPAGMSPEAYYQDWKKKQAASHTLTKGHLPVWHPGNSRPVASGVVPPPPPLGPSMLIPAPEPYAIKPGQPILIPNQGAPTAKANALHVWHPAGAPPKKPAPPLAQPSKTHASGRVPPPPPTPYVAPGTVAPPTAQSKPFWQSYFERPHKDKPSTPVSWGDIQVNITINGSAEPHKVAMATKNAVKQAMDEHHAKTALVAALTAQGNGPGNMNNPSLFGSTS